jgi:methylated-DNA-[protein]-cysteine S-methyltransferase
MTTIDVCEYDTILGAVTGATREGRLLALAFTDHWPEIDARLVRRFGNIERRAGDVGILQRRLDAYFAGDLGAFDEVAVDPGGTEFQGAVWAALRRVRTGTTTTYGALAREIGSPSAVRAVGAANGANPIWLVIPCHRAIGANGNLTGYAGGLDRKRWLLRHEGALPL